MDLIWKKSLTPPAPPHKISARKVSDGLSPPLELFSLEEKAARVAERSFRFLLLSKFSVSSFEFPASCLPFFQACEFGHLLTWPKFKEELVPSNLENWKPETLVFLSVINLALAGKSWEKSKDIDGTDCRG